MLGTTFKTVVLYAVFSFSLGFVLNDDPCDVIPEYSGGLNSDDFTKTVTVPDDCMNGTFHWDYPRGHVTLEFHNTGVITGICISGSIFTITDMTSGQHLGHLSHDKWACFQSTSGNITVGVDAPKRLNYMGEFDYTITLN